METINWATLGVIIIIGGYAWKGKNAGFIKSAFSACSMIMSIVGAVILGPIVRTILPDSPIFSYVLAFVIASIGLRIACEVLDIVAKLPVLNQINKTAGLLVGLVEGVFRVWVLFIILDMFAATEWGNALLVMVHSNEYVKMLYENNWLYMLWNIF